MGSSRLLVLPRHANGRRAVSGDGLAVGGGGDRELVREEEEGSDNGCMERPYLRG